MNIDDLINLDQFPIADPDLPVYVSFLAMCREQLAHEGAVVFTEFTTPAGTEALRREAEAWLPQAYYCAISHNCFLRPRDPEFPDNHPRNRLLHNNKGGVADDQIPADARLRKIYDWPALRIFLADLLGYQRLYPMADPVSSLNVNVHRPGQVQGWHFDGAPFAITLMLASTKKGGRFEYIPGLRDDQQTNYAAIDAVLNGARDQVRTLQIGDGTLVIFKGQHSLHCVTAPEDQSRVNAILSFATQPGVCLDPHTQRTFYGRTT